MVSGLRSRFSPGEYNLKRIAWLDIRISRLAIQIGMYVQDHQTLLEFYSTVTEKWQIIRYIFGMSAHVQVLKIKDNCAKLLDEYKSKKIDHKVHNNLLALRDIIDRFGQFANLGIEVERTNKGIYSKVKEDIIE